MREQRERERERSGEKIALMQKCTEPYQKLTALMDVFEYARGEKEIVK